MAGRVAGGDMSETGGTRTILVAEDDEFLRRLIGRFLEDSDEIIARLARDGPDARQILERYPDAIDLLVTDVVMRSPGGFELAALAVEARPDLRVLYISGYFEDSRHVREGLKQSGRFFLKKPFDKATFLRTIETALTQPPPRPTDGFAFLLGYPPITARVILQWDRRLEATSPRDARYELALPVGVSVAGRVTDGVTTNISRSGLRLVTHTAILAPVATGMEVSLRLELPSDGARSAAVTAQGRITRFEHTVSDSAGSGLSVAVRNYRPDVRR